MTTVDFTHLSPRNEKYQKHLVTVANGATFVTLDLAEKEKIRAANIIYMHVHRQSKKCYVGITVQEAGKRWFTGVTYRLNRRFGMALKKHGWDSFDSYVLAFAESRCNLNDAEVQAIAAAGGHKSKYTYNLSPGGDIVAENDKPLVGVLLATGEERHFKSGSHAARQLGMKNTDMPMAVARCERTSVAGWWFRFEEDVAARIPETWGEDLRVDAVRRRQGKKVIAINYSTGEQLIFDTTMAAAQALGIGQSAVSVVARGKDYSAKGWWFKFEGDDRPMPSIHGQKAGRLKRDRTIYAVNLKTGGRQEFRNCTVADNELGIYKGAAAMVASGDRTSASDWWFTYDKEAMPPKEFKGALVAKARSKAVVATDLATGNEQHFVSAKTAAEVLGMSRSAICQVISGKRKAAKGYRFRLARKNKSK